MMANFGSFFWPGFYGGMMVGRFPITFPAHIQLQLLFVFCNSWRCRFAFIHFIVVEVTAVIFIVIIRTLAFVLLAIFFDLSSTIITEFGLLKSFVQTSFCIFSGIVLMSVGYFTFCLLHFTFLYTTFIFSFYILQDLLYFFWPYCFILLLFVFFKFNIFCPLSCFGFWIHTLTIESCIWCWHLERFVFSIRTAFVICLFVYLSVCLFLYVCLFDRV